MLPGKLLVTGVLAAFLAGGCVQKKPQSHKSTSPAKTVSKPVIKDSTDIFDEFYKDEAQSSNVKKGNEKGSKGSTFSTSPRKVVSSGQMVEDGKYVIQISTVKNKHLADKVAAQLGDKGIPAYVVEVQNPTPQLTGTFYRVRIGGFTSIASAKSFGENSLRSAGFEFWVDKKANDNVGIEGYGMGSGAGSSYSNGSSSTSYSGIGGSNSYSSEPAVAEPPPVTPTPVAASPAPAPAPAPATPAAASPAPSSSAKTPESVKKGPDTTGWGNAW